VVEEVACPDRRGREVVVFLGTHTPRLDAKGRLALPAKFRGELEEGLVITKGQDRCLYVFPLRQFEAMSAGLGTDFTTNATTRSFNRNFFSGASDEMPDAQGRVTIPPHLRTYAGLSKECVVIGANTHVEVWDAEAWNAYLEQTEQSFSDSGEVLEGQV
jgi:MraZ protein